MYVCMYVYVYVCIMYRGIVQGVNVLPKMGGGIVRGELSMGNYLGGIVLHSLYRNPWSEDR